MDVRQLKVLLAVIESGGLAQASAKLNLSQPSLTKIIKRFEDELAVKLFVRQARGMVPTEYALALVPYARGAVANLMQAADEIQALQKGAKGHVSIVSSSAIGRQILPAAIVNLMRSHPEIQVSVSIEPSETLAENLERTKFDIGLGVLEGKVDQETSHRLLFYDSIIIACKAGHPLTQVERVQAADLASYKWVAADRRSITRNRFDYLFQSWGLATPEISIECRSTAIAKEIISATEHLCLLSASNTQKDIAEGRLSTISIEGANLNRPIGLFWKRGRLHTPAVKSLIEEIARVCETRKYAKRPLIGGVKNRRYSTME